MIRFHPPDRGGRVDHRAGVTALTVALVLAAALAAPALAQRKAQFKAGWLKVEYNSSAEDIGVQLFLDSDGWRSLKLKDLAGNTIFQAATSGILLDQGGGTELFLESVEPPLDELPIEEFLERFREGAYVLEGRTPEGTLIRSRLEFSDDIPEGPHIVTPPQGNGCPLVGGSVVIAWEPVTSTIEGEPIAIETYQVIVENGAHLDVIMPASAGNQLTVPAELLEPGDYLFEVLAIAPDDGNQTITEGCFTFTG